MNAPELRDGMTREERAVLASLHAAGGTSRAEFVPSIRVLSAALRVSPNEVPELYDALATLDPAAASSTNAEVDAAFRRAGMRLTPTRKDPLLEAAFAHYATLVRLTHGFRVSRTMIDTKGNFGSVDGDPPADPPFTECRLSRFGELLFDPAHASVSLPLQLVTGTEAPRIMPAFDTARIATALLALSSDKNASIELGPPVVAMGSARFVDADAVMQTGRGIVELSGRACVEREHVVVDAFPWLVAKSAWQEQLAKDIRLGRATLVGGFQDESERDSVRVVVEPKNRSDLDALLGFVRGRLHIRQDVELVVNDEGELRPVAARELLHRFLATRVVHLGTVDAVRADLERVLSNVVHA